MKGTLQATSTSGKGGRVRGNKHTGVTTPHFFQRQRSEKIHICDWQLGFVI